MSGVLDLAYGETYAGVDDLFEHIDEPGLGIPVTVPVGAVQVTHPSPWGPRRVAEFRRRLAAVGLEATPVPRAVAIARSHADATVRRCAVLETQVAPSTGGDWMMHLVERQDDDWTVTRVAVTEPGDVSDDPEWAAVAAAADIAVVDGPDRASVEEAMRALAAPPGGVIRADRGLLARHGGRSVSARTSLAAALPPPPEPLPRPKTPIVVGVVMCMLVGVAWFLVRPGPSPAESATQRVGVVQVDVPAGWRRSDQPDDRPSDGSGERVVFADVDGGGRILVVVTRLRAGSTMESVSASLSHRLAQRGDDAVLEFAPDTAFAGRRVISYRERPASGALIAWYIDVDRSVQTSIGCQSGSGGETVDAACAAVVASVRPA